MIKLLFANRVLRLGNYYTNLRFYKLFFEIFKLFKLTKLPNSLKSKKLLSDKSNSVRFISSSQKNVLSVESEDKFFEASDNFSISASSFLPETSNINYFVNLNFFDSINVLQSTWFSFFLMFSKF